MFVTVGIHGNAVLSVVARLVFTHLLGNTLQLFLFSVRRACSCHLSFKSDPVTMHIAEHSPLYKQRSPDHYSFRQSH